MRVTLPGHGKFALIGDLTEGALAPEEYVDEKGDIKDLETALNGLPYAHLSEDGIIRRFHQQIGTREDLIIED